MARTLSDLLGIFGQSTGQTMGGDLALTRESPSTYAQLFTGAPKEESFWAKPGGKALGSILSVLGTGGIGALLGLLGSPEARGLGAARGAAMGAGAGAMMDIGQRRAASQAGANEAEINLAKQQAELGATPSSIKELAFFEKMTPEQKSLFINFLRLKNPPTPSTFQKDFGFTKQKLIEMGMSEEEANEIMKSGLINKGIGM